MSTKGYSNLRSVKETAPLQVCEKRENIETPPAPAPHTLDPPPHPHFGDTGDLQSHRLVLCLFKGTRFQSLWSGQVTLAK